MSSMVDKAKKNYWILEPISKFLFIIGYYWVVIPAKAGIHVQQDFQWTPAFAGVTDFIKLSILR
jgi:hypothetical protein